MTNTSDTAVHNVTVREKLPEHLKIEQAQPEPSQESTAGEQVWRLGTLPAGESQNIQVRATTQQEGGLQSCLGVDFQPTMCTQLQVVKPELEFARDIVDQNGQPQEQFLACEDIYAQYRVTNVGSGTTQTVRIREEFSDVLRPAEQQNTVQLEADPLQSQETFEERVPLQAAQQTGKYTGRATATTGELTVHSAESTVQILKPELEVIISGPKQEFVDRSLTYDFEVKNVSQAPALDTILRLETPDNAQRLTYSGRDVQADGTALQLGRIDPGETRNLSVTFNIPEPGQVSLQGMARAYCADAAQVQLTTQVAGIPAVSLEVIDLHDPVRVGEETTYEIRVKNQGSAEDLNVNVQAQLPSGLRFVEGRGDTPVQSQGQTVKFGRIERLAPGDMMSWYVKAKANEAGRVRLRLEMTSDATQRPIIEQEPTRLY